MDGFTAFLNRSPRGSRLRLRRPETFLKNAD